MQVVSKKISAVHAAVPIENSEISRLLPLPHHVFRFCKVEDDCHSIFIILPHWTLVSRGRVGADGAVTVL